MELSDKEGKDAGAEAAMRTRRQRFRLLGVVVAVAGLGSGVYWLMTRNHQTTDDAFIEADIVRIAPQVGGPVVTLAFADNQRIEQGAVLLEIDPRDYQIAVAQARANLDVAKASRAAAAADLALTQATTTASVDEARNAVDQARQQIDQYRQQAAAAEAEADRSGADVKRYQELTRSEVASRQRYEQASADARGATAKWRASKLAVTAAQSQLAQAQARLANALAAPQRIAQKEAQLKTAEGTVLQAEAALASAELNLSYTRLIAPQTGRITRRAVNVGDVVQKNQILASLVVDPPWVMANYKETQLTRMRPGQPVVISVDAFPDRDLNGHVDSIQAGSGARFSLLPAENATGNYVKVVQRVPVKIVFDKPGDPLIGQLSPGMSVVPDVDVGAAPRTP